MGDHKGQYGSNKEKVFPTEAHKGQYGSNKEKVSEGGMNGSPQGASLLYTYALRASHVE